MAKYTISGSTTWGTVITNLNGISNNLGDPALLTLGDSDIVTAINRLDSLYTGAIDATTLNGYTAQGIFDSARSETLSLITSEVDKPFVDALSIDAATLNTFTAQDIYDSAVGTIDKSFVDALSINADTLDGDHAINIYDSAVGTALALAIALG